jgi:ribosome-binding factor A
VFPSARQVFDLAGLVILATRSLLAALKLIHWEIVMPKPKRGFARTDRIADQIQRELAELLQKSLKDPRVGWITLTSVEVTRDYSHAKVYYTVMDGKTREATEEALAHAAGYLRVELGRRLQIFTSPQLQFVYDESIERGLHMSQLIDAVAQEYKGDEPAEGEAAPEDGEEHA